MFGGAIGDALGYPVEFLQYKNIIFEYGEEGIMEFDLRHGGKAVLHASRALGNTCMSVIATSDGMESTENEINNSKGCGGVMRALLT